MRKAHFVIVGALGLGLFGTSVDAAPSSTVSPIVREQPKTSQELLVQAEGLVGKIASQLNDNRALQSHARTSRDALKLGCIENQLVTSRALSEASNVTITSLRASVVSGKGSDVALQSQVLVALASESDLAHSAAAACLGSMELTQKRSEAALAVPLPAQAGGKAVSGRLDPIDSASLNAAKRLLLVAGGPRPVPASP